MPTNNDKTVLVFQDEGSKIEFCDMGQELAGLTNPPIVFVCENGECENGELTTAEKLSIRRGNPENMSVWVSNEKGGLQCVSTPNNRGLLEKSFKAELLQRFTDYANALMSLGVKEIHIIADENIQNVSEKKKSGGIKGSASKAGNGGEANLNVSSENDLGFIHQIQKVVDLSFEQGALVSIDEAMLKKKGFWDDEIVQAIILARKQGRDLDDGAKEISSRTTEAIRNKFNLALGVAIKTIAWEGKMDTNYQSSLEQVSYVAQHIKIKVKTGFSMANQRLCPKCNHAINFDSKFCPNCGEPLVRKCAKCGTVLKPGMNFCPECGAKV